MTSPSPLAAARRDALTLRGQGDLRAARDLLERALAAARPRHGDDHPEVLATEHALARLHREAGDLAAARRVLEAALTAGERRHAAEPVLLGIAFDLGTMAEMRGDVDEASRQFARVARYGPPALGADHWAVRAATDYLDGGDSEITRPITSFTPRPGPVPRREEPPKARPNSLADLPEGAALRVDPTPVSAPPWADAPRPDALPLDALPPDALPPDALPLDAPPPDAPRAAVDPTSGPPAVPWNEAPPDPWADPDRWADLRGEPRSGRHAEPDPDDHTGHGRYGDPDRWADLRGDSVPWATAGPTSAPPAPSRPWDEYRPAATAEAPAKSRTGTTVRVVAAVLAGVATTAAVAYYLATGELPSLP